MSSTKENIVLKNIQLSSGDSIKLNIKELKLKKWNLIYGYNGSGKTLLSNFFRAIQEDKRLREDYSFSYNGKGFDKLETDFTQQNIAICVFNRDFVDENVFCDSDNDNKKGAKAIHLTLSDEHKKDLDRKAKLENFKAILDFQDSVQEGDYKDKDLKNLNSKLKDIECNFKKICSEIAKNVQNGLNLNPRFESNNCKDTIFNLQLLENSEENSKKYILIEEDYKNKRSDYDNRKDNIDSKLSEISLLDKKLGGEILDILNTPSQNQSNDDSENIKRFKEKFTDNTFKTWFKKGKEDFFKEKTEECPYCTAKIADDIAKAIKEVFDDTEKEFAEKKESVLGDLKNYGMVFIGDIKNKLNIHYDPEKGEFNRNTEKKDKVYDSLHKDYDTYLNSLLNEGQEFLRDIRKIKAIKSLKNKNSLGYKPTAVGVAIHHPALSLRTHRVSVAISGSLRSLLRSRDDGDKKLQPCDDGIKKLKYLYFSSICYK